MTKARLTSADSLTVRQYKNVRNYSHIWTKKYPINELIYVLSIRESTARAGWGFPESKFRKNFYPI
jgi:hypothetical protein